MFARKLSYYHGTTWLAWEKITHERLMRPHDRLIDDYWLAKGVYFVCENPLVALWYAWKKYYDEKEKNGNSHTMKQNEPIVIKLSYEDKNGSLNLLSIKGQKKLAMAHFMWRKKLQSSLSDIPKQQNLDCTVLQLLADNAALTSVIAAFQEGLGIQEIIHSRRVESKYDKEFRGIRYGDHAEICFTNDLKLDEFSGDIQPMNHQEVLNDQSDIYFWKIICQGFVQSLPENSKKLRNFFEIYAINGVI